MQLNMIFKLALVQIGLKLSTNAIAVGLFFALVSLSHRHYYETVIIMKPIWTPGLKLLND